MNAKSLLAATAAASLALSPAAMAAGKGGAGAKASSPVRTSSQLQNSQKGMGGIGGGMLVIGGISIAAIVAMIAALGGDNPASP